MLKYNFENKTVLITASSKGIGFALAKQLALSGAKVSMNSRSANNLKKAKNDILSLKKNAKIFTIKQNLEDTKNLKNIIIKTEKFFKSKIDILINNSGGPDPKLIMDTTNKDWEKALNINLKSAIYLSMHAIKNMKKKNWGRIINLTSTTAKEPAKNMCLSNITRSGLTSFSKTLSMEVVEYGITVNSILTGGVLTERLKNLLKKSIKKKKYNFEKEIKNLSKNIPVQKIASPDEFIQLILFLCSENSSYVNGAAIPIDGGVSKGLF
tara:strand:- start:1446 stop:2246 length:801 start_codon:yes stop_codon:yes gene_type:complete